MLKVKKSVVVFDVDGTMFDSDRLIQASVARAIQSEGVKVDDPFSLEIHLGCDERGIIRHYVGDAGKADRAFGVYLQAYEELHQELMPHPIEGIPELLRSLRDRRTLRMGVITGRTKESLDISFDIFNLTRFFESIHTGSPKGVVKSQNMALLFDDLGVNRNECIYVGDSLHDVSAMRRAGVSIISVCYLHPEKREKLEEVNPGMVASSVEELEDILLRNIR